MRLSRGRVALAVTGFADGSAGVETVIEARAAAPMLRDPGRLE